MKKYLLLFFVSVLVTIALALFINDYFRLKRGYSDARNNIKAYEQLYDSTVNQNRQFSLTIDELNYSRDSLVRVLNAVRKENKILDKKIKSLSYVSSIVEIHDTLTLRDTLLVREGVSLDTALVSPGYNIDFHLAYPDTLGVGITVPSEKYIIASKKRETIDPPKKCFLGRLFQKKHTVVDVQVIEKNPYIKSNQSRFIEVVD
jgi:hypothetical protein